VSVEAAVMYVKWQRNDVHQSTVLQLRESSKYLRRQNLPFMHDCGVKG